MTGIRNHDEWSPGGYDFMWVVEDFEKYLSGELDFEGEALRGRKCGETQVS